MSTEPISAVVSPLDRSSSHWQRTTIRNWFLRSPHTLSMKFMENSPTDGVSRWSSPITWRHRSSEADLRRYLALLTRHGIAFNYLLNGACFGNREWTRPWQNG